jgi:phosphatidylserine decarboxylase
MDAFVTLQNLLPQHGLSRLVGAAADCTWPWLAQPLIRIIQRSYGIDLAEATSDHFDSLNSFFTRALREDARPLGEGLISPVDGRVSECGPIHEQRLIQAKGHRYRLDALLGVTDASAYAGGSFITIYLAPHNYHRVHVPWDAQLTAARYIPGRLFSVNPRTVAAVPDLFARNERLVCHFETAAGPRALIMVGAMLVAGIRSNWRSARYEARRPVDETFEPARTYARGDELGCFDFGSTVILVESAVQAWRVTANDPVTLGMTLAS